MRSGSKDIEGPLILCACLLGGMELWKQAYLYFFYFNMSYRIWYLPFQLCSLPIYLLPAYIALRHCRNPASMLIKRSILLFLQDFGLLGGMMALIVPDGFIYPGHPFLTMHGYLWHVLMVLVAFYISGGPLGEFGMSGSVRGSTVWGQTMLFLHSMLVFLPAVFLAEAMNIFLHPFGDCDMFYISPYHLSSQPVFHEIDVMVGRPAGIVIYLLSIVMAAWLIHLGLWRLKYLRESKDKNG